MKPYAAGPVGETKARTDADAHLRPLPRPIPGAPRAQSSPTPHRPRRPACGHRDRSLTYYPPAYHKDMPACMRRWTCPPAGTTPVTTCIATDTSLNPRAPLFRGLTDRHHPPRRQTLHRPRRHAYGRMTTVTDTSPSPGFPHDLSLPRPRDRDRSAVRRTTPELDTIITSGTFGRLGLFSACHRGGVPPHPTWWSGICSRAGRARARTP